jgi:hypothetical protein
MIYDLNNQHLDVMTAELAYRREILLASGGRPSRGRWTAWRRRHGWGRR